MDELRELHRSDGAPTTGEWWSRLGKARKVAGPELLEWYRAGRLPFNPDELQRRGVTTENLAELLERGEVTDSKDFMGGIALTVDGPVRVDRTVLRHLRGMILLTPSKSVFTAEWT